VEIISIWLLGKLVVRELLGTTLVDRRLTYRAAIVGGRQAVGARLWAGVHLRTAPAGSGWRVNGAWDDIAAGGEVCLRADDAGEGRDGDQKR